ncbi:hypothetical protein IID62_10920, partial [candidate division KSB1 bacterium]|nr:hypothetical protein [candidate division KSB1 bacterium]
MKKTTQKIFNGGNIFIFFGSSLITIALYLIMLIPVNAMTVAHSEMGLDGLDLTPYRMGMVGDVDNSRLDPDKYLKDELESTKRLSHSQSKKSKARWENDSSSKSLKNKDTVDAVADNGHSPANASPTPTPIPTPNKEKIYKKEFSDWYKLYPLKKARANAEKAYLKVRKNGASAE